MTPSIVHDVRDILLIKGLDDPYVSEKMSGFETSKQTLKLLLRLVSLIKRGECFSLRE